MADKQKYIREIRGQLFLRGLQTDEEKKYLDKRSDQANIRART